MPAEGSEIVVIGAGAMRTGTLSLKAALEILLKQPCYHMKDVVKNARSHIPLWTEASQPSGLTKPLADKLFNGYAACVGYPAASYYQDLMRLYPNALVVLSVRDADSWVASVQESIVHVMHAVSMVPYPLLWFWGLNRLHEMVETILRKEYGEDANLLNSADLARRFVARNNAVRAAVPPNRLLEFRATDGWLPLCQFLGLPVPDVPYPRLNDRDSVQRIIRAVTIVTYTLHAATAVGGLCLALWLHRRICG